MKLALLIFALFIADVVSGLGITTHFGAIAGGETNCISSASGYHSFIGGGCNNVVQGACSAILGGSGNTDNGWALTGMYGTGLAGANIPSGLGAFWVNELVAPSMPMGTLVGGIPVPPATYPTGSLWYYPDVNGNCVVYIV